MIQINAELQMNSTFPYPECFSTVPWWVSYVPSYGIILVGFVLIGLIRFREEMHNIKSQKRHRKSTIMKLKSELLMNGFDEDDCFCEEEYEEKKDNLFLLSMMTINAWVEMVVSRGTQFGRIMIIVQIISHLLSWTIYVVFTYNQHNHHYMIGDCYEDYMIVLKWIDFGLNIFCILHFLLRAMAANDILQFWIQPTTMIDICVIPNILITTFLNVRRQGMSYLRVYYLSRVCDAFYLAFKDAKMNTKYESARAVMQIISLWMISTGIIQMTEAIGNFWQVPIVSQQLEFTGAAFLIITTISTIGYGDLKPITYFGQIVICFYIIYGFPTFITIYKNTMTSLQKSKEYDKYVSPGNEKFMIVSGKFENFTLIPFLKQFTKQYLRKGIREILVMNRQPIDATIASFFKKFSSTIKHLTGSLMAIKDIRRFNINKVKVAVILSSPFTNKAAEEDLINILSAVTLKAQRKKIRSIVQLHLYSNKILLKTFPTWNKYGNDIIFCLNEVKLGLIAYNSIVPGMATLIMNLMTCNTFQKMSQFWRRNYEYGLQSRIFSVQFSDDFEGLQCLDAALIIYQLWDICLVAIKYVNIKEFDYVSINPAIENHRINTESMIAIVMAKDYASAQKVSFYCSKCSHNQSTDICNCLVQNLKNKVLMNQRFDDQHLYASINSSQTFSFINSKVDDLEISQRIICDVTGSFYWTPEPNFDDICLDIQNAFSKSINDHVLVCICGSGKGIIDFCNFVMPLRSCSLNRDQLKPIVFLGNKQYFKGDRWKNIKNFPMLTIINGSPIHARDLQAAGLFECSSCVIMNGNDFPPSTIDRYSIICTTLIKSMLKNSKKEITIITEIRHDDTAYHFSTTHSQKSDNHLSVQHTEPFARGLVFSNTILYSCIYSIYENPDMFSFIKALLSGPYADKIEMMFGSGVGLLPSRKPGTYEESRVTFKLISLSDPPFSVICNIYETITFEILYKWALSEKRIVCLGLYRLNFRTFRYVYTHPAKNTEIYLSDQVYCCISNK